MTDKDLIDLMMRYFVRLQKGNVPQDEVVRISNLALFAHRRWKQLLKHRGTAKADTNV
jgi:hypothetical protein